MSEHVQAADEGIDAHRVAQVYAHLLEELREVSQHARDSLRVLHDRFPSDFPVQLLELLRGPRPDPERPPDPAETDPLTP